MTQDLGQVTSVYNNLGQDITRMYNNRSEIIWEKSNVIYDESDYRNQYFTIQADVDFEWYISGCPGGHNTYYRKNHTGEWKLLYTPITVYGETTWFNTEFEGGDIIELKSVLSEDDYGTFQGNKCVGTFYIYDYPKQGIDVPYNISGNILSLVYGDDFRDKYSLPENIVLGGMFSDKFVKDASNLVLPFTTAPNCTSMFENCKYLIKAPKLPALTLTPGCYERMFTRSYNLTKAPLLPAIHTVQNCYSDMFENCFALKYIECYAEDEANNSFTEFANGISSNGIFVKKENSNVEWQNVIPNNWEIINL